MLHFVILAYYSNSLFDFIYSYVSLFFQCVFSARLLFALIGRWGFQVKNYPRLMSGARKLNFTVIA